MGCSQRLEEWIPIKKERDSESDSEIGLKQYISSVDSENASSLFLKYESEIHSNLGSIQWSMSHRETPLKEKSIALDEVDVESDFTHPLYRKATTSTNRFSHSLRDGKNLSLYDNSQSRNIDELLQNKRSRSFGILDDDNTPRDHPLYQRPIIGADGLYHCPWEEDPSCNHKPEKLKCNYDKFVDSHLKPYRCKVAECENARFSSTACLLRHEREAHAMHGYGERPFLCSFHGCERGVPGNGFPRHWNLCDHMKRVHNRSPSPLAGTVKPPKSSKKRKYSTEGKASNKNALATSSGFVEKAHTAVHFPSSSKQFQHVYRRLLSELMDIPNIGNIEDLEEKIEKASGFLKLMVSETQKLKSGSPYLNSRENSVNDANVEDKLVITRAEKERESADKFQARVEDEVYRDSSVCSPE